MLPAIITAGNVAKGIAIYDATVIVMCPHKPTEISAIVSTYEICMSETIFNTAGINSYQTTESTGSIPTENVPGCIAVNNSTTTKSRKSTNTTWAVDRNIFQTQIQYMTFRTYITEQARIVHSTIMNG